MFVCIQSIINLQRQRLRRTLRERERERERRERDMEGDGNSCSTTTTTNDVYRECLRNHAASLGSYATDGCGEFTLQEESSPAAGSLQCAACGCHRNFHRKVSYSSSTQGCELTADYGGGRRAAAMESAVERMGGSGKKRFRTKFTAEQKEKMMAFAEKLGWKLQRKDMEEEVERFCKAVGVSRQVFKVWMHNHKNSSSSSSASTGNASSLTTQ